MTSFADTQVRLSQDRQRLLDKVEASREEYACLKQQHLFELDEQARRLTMAKVVRCTVYSAKWLTHAIRVYLPVCLQCHYVQPYALQSAVCSLLEIFPML